MLRREFDDRARRDHVSGVRAAVVVDQCKLDLTTLFQRKEVLAIATAKVDVELARVRLRRLMSSEKSKAAVSTIIVFESIDDADEAVLGPVDALLGLGVGDDAGQGSLRCCLVGRCLPAGARARAAGGSLALRESACSPEAG